jgi:L-2-hydroxyglutarate oxidase LhgO
VVGLAVARRLALDGRDVVVLEAAEGIGTETSSRNSEVIHAGIYYAKDSLKAKLCVAGKWRLYDYCKSHGVPFRNCGKLIVATTEAEAALLEGICRRGLANGVDDLVMIGGNQARAMEPAVKCVAAIHSPSTGIVDSHSLMLSYQGEAEGAGAMLAFHTAVTGGAIEDAGIRVETADYTLRARTVVNCAGLHAQRVAALFDGFPAACVPPTYYCKGSYFSLTGKQPFTRLIYPVPASASLGVHVTLDMGGQCKFGPDQEWVDEIRYDVEPDRADVFYDAVRRYWPDLPDGALVPGYAGIRPKIQAPDEPMHDFLVQGPADHGIAGMVNLFGIESPGLTSSLAIADLVAERLQEPTGTAVAAMSAQQHAHVHKQAVSCWARP